MAYPSQDRNQAFGDGHQMSSGDVQQASQAAYVSGMNISGSHASGPSTVQRGSGHFQANGVNQPIVRSGIGSSVKDADRMTYGGGSTPTSNGMSTSTYAAKRPLLNTSLGI
jgi:hypothetical protein